VPQITRLLVAAISVATLSTPSAAQTAPSRSVLARRVDSLARDFIAGNGAPAVSIAVVRAGDTVVMNGWGRADIENDVPATAATVYRIGSITKQFTSSTVMQLVQSGQVALDSSIGNYLPALPAAWRVVTVRQLLNHTSGIPSYTDLGPRWERRWGEEMSPDTLVALTATDTMWFAPGSKWRYDNTGYIVLGMLVEKVTSHSWADEIATRFTKPFGLTSTYDCLTQPIIPHRAHGYQPAEPRSSDRSSDRSSQSPWENATYLAMTQPFSAGAMCSTVHDLARWDGLLGAGRVVTPASYALMTTPEGAAANGDLHYGFGLGRDTLAGHDVITHGGGIPGFISSNVWFPDAKLSITVLTNSGAANPGVLMKQIARAAFGVPLEQPAKVVALPPAQRAKYVGVYALQLPDAVHDFTVTDAGTGLTGQLAGQNAFQLLYYGNDTFGASFDPTLRIVFTVQGTAATKLTLHQGGGTFDGPRK
jgi:D-alanyl-D-alanine carboxypeptidase